MPRKLLLILACLLVCFCVLAARPAQAERRSALVIGNGAYASAPLRNPVNDARAMAATLRSLGFEVIHLENASQAMMEDALNALGRLLAKGGVGLFYYAGHGVQAQGRNYLIPVQARLLSESDLPQQAVDASAVLERMEQANNDLNIIILDACRNNPFAMKLRSGKGGAGGLAAMQAPKGSLIAFATSPGSVASDGSGENGVYTKHLLENLRTPGLQVEQMFKLVRSGVIAETNSQQRPWETTSIQGDFVFADAGGAAPVAEEPHAAAAPATTPATTSAATPAPADVAAQPTPKSRSNPIQVEFAMFRENGKKPPTPVSTGGSMRSGDAYFFHVRPSQDCFLYLFQVDATGKAFRLFPNDAYHTQANPVLGKANLTLPNQTEVFYLDQTVGKEEFYFLASEEPVAQLENLDASTVDGIMRSGMTLRGPAGVKAAMGAVAASGAGEQALKVQEFSFVNSFVHAIAIKHK